MTDNRPVKTLQIYTDTITENIEKKDFSVNKRRQKNTVNIDRFVKMQKLHFATAYNEIKNGKKETHWIWYIFPQVEGLGKSSIAKEFELTIEEAEAYIKNIYLMNNLRRITKALLDINNKDIISIVGEPDNLKVRSCMTLFFVLTNEKIFEDVLKKYYSGVRDDFTFTSLFKYKQEI